jgi:hypothetical protein
VADHVIVASPKTQPQELKISVSTRWATMIKPTREAAVRDTTIIKWLTLIAAFLRCYRVIVENPVLIFGAMNYLKVARSL